MTAPFEGNGECTYNNVCIFHYQTTGIPHRPYRYIAQGSVFRISRIKRNAVYECILEEKTAVRKIYW